MLSVKRLAAALALLLLPSMTPSAAMPAAPTESITHRYLVLYADGVSNDDAAAELEGLGAEIVAVNEAIGLATARSSDPGFVADVARSDTIYGIARDRSIGTTELEEEDSLTPRSPGPAGARRPQGRASENADPLFRYQWNMRMVRATPKGSYSLELGDRRVLVGVLDSGIDVRHADLRSRVDRDLSQSFVTGSSDGERCRTTPDHPGCASSPFRDPIGHGTAVGSLIAGARNGFGMSGVAPKATLVSLRVGGHYVFLQPVVDALTYAADNGLDVANMSFFIDPWLFNCPDNPADDEQQQQEQRTIVEAVQQAVDYARSRGVTPITATGNEALDLGKPKVDNISPDYPPGASYRRDVDNSCLMVPQETDGVIGVSGLGPSTRKAFYSDYGIERTDASAPGGDFHDRADHPVNQMLVAMSKLGLRKSGLIDKNGKPRSDIVLRRCRKDKCSYYLFGQGTSFAAPMATGVAALIVSARGTSDGAGGFGHDPAAVEADLLDTATPHRCPKGGVQRYRGLGKRYTAVCEEREGGNGFYGAGIVDALRAVRR
ncbi:MAG TPA: S8 family serine peptidase [Actinomycetota bacterium]